MDLIISKNGYSDYKRKTIDDNAEYQDDVKKEKEEVPFKSYL